MPTDQSCAYRSELCLKVRAVPEGQSCAHRSEPCPQVRAVPTGQSCAHRSELCPQVRAVPTGQSCAYRSERSLAGQPLATPTAGRGESGKIPIIGWYLTRQEFLGVLSGFNGAAVAFHTLVCGA